MHKPTCPCCLVRRSPVFLVLLVALVAAGAYGVSYVSRLSVLVGRGPMVAVLSVAFLVVGAGIVSGIRGSVRSGRNGVRVAESDSAPAVVEYDVPEGAEDAPVAPVLRLVREADVA